MLAGTKTSVEDLLPKSEQLLSQTQRQERAISNIHYDLNEKTNAIMKELSQVERELLVTKTSGGYGARLSSDGTTAMINYCNSVCPKRLKSTFFF